MRHTALALLALAACSRSFTPSQSTPRSSGIYLPNGSLLPANGRVAALTADGSGPATLAIHGENLSTVTAVLVGGVAVTPSSVTDAEVDFSAPAPDSGAYSVAQSTTVSVLSGSGEQTVAQLRFYLPPQLQLSPVNAPSQVVLQGSNFSPVAGEDLLTFGSTNVPVLLATSESLLVNLSASLGEGSQQVQLSIALDGAPPLTTSAPIVVWKVVPQFWIDPPQVFAGQHVQFKAMVTDEPPPDLLDNASSLAAGSSDLSANAVGGPAAPDGGNALATPGLAANYQPTGDAGYDPTSTDPTDRSANSKLDVLLDGVATLVSPDINASDELSWTVPPTASVGTHAVTVTDPAGTSAAASLIVLPGHLASPAPSCWPLDFAPQGAVAPTLAYSQSQGEVLLWAPDDGGLQVRSIHPGGGLADRSVDAAVFGGASPDKLIAAGPTGLYVSAAEPGGEQLMVVGPLGTPRPVASDAAPDGGFLAVLPPNLNELYTWVLESGWLPRLCNAAGYCTNSSPALLSGQPGASLLRNCSLLGGTLSPDSLEGAIHCDDGLHLLTATVPNDQIDFASTVKIHRVTDPGGADFDASSAIAFGGKKVLIVSGSGSAFVASVDRLDLEAAQQLPAAEVVAGTLSPDGQQALLGIKGGALVVVDQVGPTNWMASQFDLGGTITQLAYDAAGSHAVAAVKLNSGMEYCELH